MRLFVSATKLTTVADAIFPQSTGAALRARAGAAHARRARSPYRPFLPGGLRGGAAHDLLRRPARDDDGARPEARQLARDGERRVVGAHDRWLSLDRARRDHVRGDDPRRQRHGRIRRSADGAAARARERRGLDHRRLPRRVPDRPRVFSAVGRHACGPRPRGIAAHAARAGPEPAMGVARARASVSGRRRSPAARSSSSRPR
jgi:hypothetical protein